MYKIELNRHSKSVSKSYLYEQGDVSYAATKREGVCGSNRMEETAAAAAAHGVPNVITMIGMKTQQFADLLSSIADRQDYT